MIQEAAKSKVPALGYGMPYAVGNTLLTIFGMVIVLLMSGGENVGDRPWTHVNAAQVSRRLSPFEIKDVLDRSCAQTQARRHRRSAYPECRPRQSELDRDRAARGASSCSASSRSPRASACSTCRRASAACRRRTASPARFDCLARETRRHAGRRRSSARMVPWAVEAVRLRRRRLRARAGRLDHRRQLSRCPTACSCTTSRSSTSTCSGRCAASRARKGKFHLYAVEGGTAAMCYIFKSLKANRLLNRGRHDRARHADLHALSRDAAPRGLRPQDRAPCRRGRRTASSSPTRSSTKLLDPKIKAFFLVNPGNPSAIALERGVDREDRRDPEEAARPDPADRRRLRHVRAGLPLAAGRVPAQHHRRLFLQQVLRLHGLAPRRDRASTRTTSSTS